MVTAAVKRLKAEEERLFTVLTVAFLEKKGVKQWKNENERATLPGNSSVEMKEFEIPKPGHGQVLIQTKATTICGSDIRCIYREHVGKGPEGYIPGMVAGHEPAALSWKKERV